MTASDGTVPREPITLHLGNPPSEYFGAEVLSACGLFDSRMPHAVVVVTDPSVAVAGVLYGERDPDGEPVLGAAHGTVSRDGKKTSQRWICLHPHLAPHHIQPAMMHELGHLAGLLDNAETEAEIMDVTVPFAESVSPEEEWTSTFARMAGESGARLPIRDRLALLTRAFYLSIIYFFDMPDLVATLYHRLAHEYMGFGSYSAAREACVRGEALAVLPQTKATIYLFLATINTQVALFERLYFEESEALLRRAYDLAVKTDVLHLRGEIALTLSGIIGVLEPNSAQVGVWLREARDCYVLAANNPLLVDEQLRRKFLVRVLGVDLKGFLLVGDCASPRQLLQDHRALLEQCPRDYCDLWLNLANRLVVVKDWRGAGEAFDMAISLSVRLGVEVLPYHSLMCCPLSYFAAGDDASAVYRLVALEKDFEQRILQHWDCSEGAFLLCVVFDHFRIAGRLGDYVLSSLVRDHALGASPSAMRSMMDLAQSLLGRFGMVLVLYFDIGGRAVPCAYVRQA